MWQLTPRVPAARGSRCAVRAGLCNLRPCSSPSATRLQDVFRQIRGEARLTPETVEVALREIRMALLEADVNFKVVKAFIDRVRDRAVDAEVLKSLTPGQQVVRIVRDEMLALFGDTQGGLPPSTVAPRVILLLGLQGSGKTTTSAKLARLLTRAGPAPASWCRPTSAVPPPSSSSRCSASRRRFASTIPTGDLDPVSRARGALADRQSARLRHRHRRHRRPPPHRRRADGGARGDQGGGGADRPALRRRRDDRAGRDQERRRVQPPHRHHRRRAHEDGRRCARRRGAVGRVGRRRADRVRRQRRAPREPRTVPSRSRRLAHPRHGRRAVAHREGRAGRRSGRSARSSKRSSGRTSSRSRTSAISCGRSRDGPARIDPRDAARHGQHQAGDGRRSTRSSCCTSRRSSTR